VLESKEMDVTLNDFVKEILEEIKNRSAELNIVLS